MVLGSKPSILLWKRNVFWASAKKTLRFQSKIEGLEPQTLIFVSKNQFFQNFDRFFFFQKSPLAKLILLSRLLSRVTPRWRTPPGFCFFAPATRLLSVSPRRVGQVAVLIRSTRWNISLNPPRRPILNPLGDRGASRVNLCGWVPWLRFPKKMPCYVMDPSNCFLVVAHSFQLKFK